MNKVKKIALVSLIWNFIMAFLLFFQGAIIMNVVRDNLLPNVEFVKSLLDGKIVEFIKERATLTFMIIGLILLAEFITFFIVNYKLSKKYKYLNFNGGYQYYKYINIYMIISVITFVGLIVFFGVKIYSMLGTVDFNLNHLFTYIYNTAMNMEIDKITNLKSFLEQIMVQVKMDDTIYAYSLHSIDILYYFKKIWIFISYIVLIYGGFIDIKFFNNGLSIRNSKEKIGNQ